MSQKKQTRWYRPKRRPKREKIFLSGDDFRARVLQDLAGHLGSDIRFYVADERYYLAPRKDIQEIVKEAHLELLEWKKEKFDCDDFARQLHCVFAMAAYKDGKRRAPYALGQVWGVFDGEDHAINFVMDDMGILWLIEPQTGEMWSPGKKDKDIYFLIA